MNSFLSKIRQTVWFVLRIFVPNGRPRRGTGEITSEIDSPQLRSRRSFLTSIPEDRDKFGIDPDGLTDYHLMIYGVVLVSSYLMAVNVEETESAGI